LEAEDGLLISAGTVPEALIVASRRNVRLMEESPARRLTGFRCGTMLDREGAPCSSR
jgi:hypothetical protein